MTRSIIIGVLIGILVNVLHYLYTIYYRYNRTEACTELLSEFGDIIHMVYKASREIIIASIQIFSLTVSEGHALQINVCYILYTRIIDDIMLITSEISEKSYFRKSYIADRRDDIMLKVMRDMETVVYTESMKLRKYRDNTFIWLYVRPKDVPTKASVKATYSTMVETMSKPVFDTVDHLIIYQKGARS